MGDWPRICDIWKNTFEERQSELNTTISTFDYIKKYPGLQGIQAVELVTIDLKIKHPEATSVEEWISTFPKIISKVKTSRDIVVVGIIKDIEESTNESKSYKKSLRF